MAGLGAVAAALLIGVIFVDTFEALILPRLAISAPRWNSALPPPPIPITTTRPRVFSELMFSARLGPPISSRITSNGPSSPKPSGSITLAPKPATSPRNSMLRTVAVTLAPAATPSSTTERTPGSLGGPFGSPLRP